MRERILVGFVALVCAAAAAAQLDDAAVREAVRQRVEAISGQAASACGRRICATATIPGFFEARGFRPAWTEQGQPREAVARLVSAIEEIATEGLAPAHYHLDAIRQRAAVLQSGKATAQEVADLEVLATDAFVVLASHLLSGKVDPEQLDSEWLAMPRSGNLAPLLEQALTAADFDTAFRSLLPEDRGYAALRDAYLRYARLAASGGWAPVSTGPTLGAGQDDPRVVELRARLAATGDLTASPEQAPSLFDSALEADVSAFQRRHGLDADGRVGRETLAALNSPVSTRVATLRANMERWRWLPESLGERHILVNIAGFAADVVEKGETVLSMRAIVGKPYRRTPVFSDRVTYLVLNPSWNVPHLLAVQDILPQVKKNPDYLAAQGITVIEGWGADARTIAADSIDWQQLSAGRFPYRLRQEPGALNALGRVKFMFPNKFNVYLHDTPSRGLFARAARDFSSGCIRVEKPVELATLLTGGASGWNAERIAVALETGKEQTVTLPRPIPVHLLYWTAWVDRDGTVQFRRDIYDRDPAVLTALDEPPPHP